MVLDADRRPYSEVLGLLRRFHRILIRAEPDALRALGEAFRQDAMTVEEGLDVVKGEGSRTMEELRSRESRLRLPEGWHFTSLCGDSPADLVASVQALHLSSGLAPLPGWFLRGGEPGARTIVLADHPGALIGSATALDLGFGARSSPVRIGMVISVCLSTRARGRGLSVLLNLQALAQAVREFRSVELWEIVEHTNVSSLQMNARSGLSETIRGAFLFVEDRRPESR